MAKVLFFNFDGTDNEPADAMQEKNFLGTTEDGSITNILKFHLLLGGNLQQKTGNTLLENGSRSFYYNGIGTYGNYFERKYNAGLASESADVSTIIRLARKDFTEHFVEEGGYDFVVVTGFSRGAALARRFASTINHRVSDKQIIIEAVFDTVAAIGLPNMSQKDRPTSDVVFEHGHTLPGNVLKALHLVSLDDKRKAFQPTLMNQDGRVREIWFPGAHSDVGGGYNFDGLSDNALRYLLDWFEDQQELGITFKSSRSVQYGDIFGDSEKLAIGPDDVQIDPNPFGVNHQQDRMPLIDRLTLTDRLCCVIKDDKVIEREALKALIHQQSGNLEEAGKSMDLALTHNPTHAGMLFTAALINQKLTHFDRAKKQAMKAAREAPDSPQIICQCAMILGTVGEPHSALQTLEKFIRKNQDHAQAWYLIGKFQGDLGSDEAAAYALRKCLALQPEHDHASKLLGRISPA